MTSVFLASCTDIFIIRWIANILGFVMNLFYEIISNLGIGKISICIIVFTIIVKLCMLPINIKQQKFTKLSSVMNPEIQAIQKKYANKKDNDSLMKQQEELNLVYQKYGSSPTGGCLPMLIQMPIILALYAIMACLPNYINDVQDMYNDGVISYVIGADDSGKYDYHTINSLKDIDSLSDSLLDEKDAEDDALDVLVTAYLGSKGDNSEEEIEESVYNSFTSAYGKAFGNASVWTSVENGFDTAAEKIEELKSVDASKFQELEAKELAAYADYTEADWDELISEYGNVTDKMEVNREEIKDVYSFFGIDLSTSPATGVKFAIIIPILSALAQLLNMKISMSNQQKTGNGTADSMMSSMKFMSYSMCVVSAVLCYTLPAGLGLYWVISSLVQGLIQLVLNARFNKMDVDSIIKANMEKVNKKRAKQGLAPNTISSAATTNTRNYQTQQVSKNNSSSTTSSVSSEPKKKGSISDKANLVNKYADKK